MFVVQSLRLYPQPPVLIRRSLENDMLGRYPIKRSLYFNDVVFVLAISIRPRMMQLLEFLIKDLCLDQKLTGERISSSRFGIFIEVRFIGMTRRNSTPRDGL